MNIKDKEQVINLISKEISILEDREYKFRENAERRNKPYDNEYLRGSINTLKDLKDKMLAELKMDIKKELNGVYCTVFYHPEWNEWRVRSGSAFNGDSFTKIQIEKRYEEIKEVLAFIPQDDANKYKREDLRRLLDSAKFMFNEISSISEN